MLEHIVRQQVAAMRQAELDASDQITLGDLIDRLEACQAQDEDDPRVYFHFCKAYPTTIRSWRGSYDELALGFELLERRGEAPTIAAVLDTLREANGTTYEGYKGGEYTMSRATPVWVDNWGEYTRTAIVGVVLEDGDVYIQTARQPF